jgi:hypothetical protein
LAREPQQREDLMRDARALVERAEIVWHSQQPPLVMGRHRTGGTSFYFGEDPVYHFTSDGLLRRAYALGLLYKAEAGRLVEIRPVRVPGEVQLRSRALSAQQQADFLTTLTERLQQLLTRFDRGDCHVAAEIPVDAPVVATLMEGLRALLANPLAVAPTPHVR